MSNITKKFKKQTVNDNDLFQKPHDFKGYKMHFLKDTILVKLTDSVELRKTKFNYIIEKLSKKDTKHVNHILSGLKSELTISNFYMNVKSDCFENMEGESVNYLDDNLWNLTIVIQGYKVSTDGTLSPIWRIDNAIMT